MNQIAHAGEMLRPLRGVGSKAFIPFQWGYSQDGPLAIMRGEGPLLEIVQSADISLEQWRRTSEQQAGGKLE
jgi:hypothetical protein